MTFKNLTDEYNRTKKEIRELAIREAEIRDFEDLEEYTTFTKLEEIASMRNMLQTSLTDLRDKIVGVLQNMKNKTASEVVQYRLFTNHSWLMIARKLNYSKSRVRQLYAEGVNEIKNWEQI